VVADIQQNKQRELGFVQPGEEKAVRRPHCSLPVFKRCHGFMIFVICVPHHNIR